MKRSPWIATALVAVLLGTTGGSYAQISAGPRSTPRSVVTAKELSSSPRMDLYDFLRARRPLWLNTRGPSTLPSAGVVVYVDGSRMGGISELRGIPIDIVSRIDHFSGPEAALRWGPNHSHGVIFVTTGTSPDGVNASRAPMAG